MTKFAAHDDASIYAVADTADAAVAKARDDARDQNAQFRASPISDELADQIEEHGWDGKRQSFACNTAGVIVELMADE